MAPTRQQQQQPQQQQLLQQTDENSSSTRLGHDNQGVMVPTSGPEPSVRVVPSDRRQQPRQHRLCSQDNDPSGGDCKVEPLIVFDWDDTILTSSWIQVNELLQAGSYDDLPLEVKRDLAHLEQRCVCRSVVSTQSIQTRSESVYSCRLLATAAVAAVA